MWQWCVSRSSSAVVILASTNTLDHSAKSGLVGMTTLVELREQMEQQRAARLAERQVAELVEDDDVHAQQTAGDATGFALDFLLLQRVDGAGRGGEAETTE